MRQACLGAALVLLLTVIGCDGGHDSDVEVARVGDRIISLVELQRAFDEVLAAGDSYTPDSLSARRFLKDYVDKTLLEQIAADSIPWMPLLEHRTVSYLETLMVHKMRADAYGHAAQISEDNLRDAYEKGRLTYHYAAIHFSTRKDALNKLLTIREGARFSKVADRILGRSDGGDMGWATIFDAPESVINVLMELSPSEVGGPVEAGGVFYLVKLIETSSNRNMKPFDEIADGFRMRLIRERGGRLVRGYQEELLSKYRYEPRMAEILWIMEFLHEDTKSVPRTYTPASRENANGAGLTAAASSQQQIPWTENPFTEEEANRILSTTTVDTVSAVLYLDHLLSKPSFTWPLFEKPDEVLVLLRELVISRLERFEAWERGYGEDPDLVWKAQKRRHLIHTRQFYIRMIRPPCRPSVAEARAWYEKKQSDAGLSGQRKYLSIMTGSWDLALKVREILLEVKDPESAFQRVKAVDPFASWTGSNGTTSSKAELSPPLAAQLFRMDVGGVTDPVPMRDRFVVGRLEEIFAPQGESFEDVAERVIGDLTTIRGDSLLGVYLAKRRETTPIVIDEAV
ncbi:MAG: peptidyl-prolyl cis-trans isomerase, partial [Candidatus Eisenbacteria sp.]|nr:peptidyl-prolyl cis-trans isomerase [Candidatus Eisenbacteria bacterium]